MKKKTTSLKRKDPPTNAERSSGLKHRHQTIEDAPGVGEEAAP
jgi:hypothetical protein